MSVDEFRIAVAETYDVIAVFASEEAYTIFACSLHGSDGYARGTLALREGLVARIPAAPTSNSSPMDDMGMGGMAGMDHGSMAGMGGAEKTLSGDMSGMMVGMAGMDHSKMIRMTKVT